jgi:ribosome-binding factor A
VTVGEVRVAPDLRIATVFVMPLGGRAPQEAIVALSRHRGELRRMVSRGMTLKHAPDLRFVADETFDRMDETRRLLAEPRVQRDIADSGEETEGDGSGLV